MKKKNVKKNVKKNEIMEQDGVSLNQKTINCMKKNKRKILQKAYILGKTSMMTDSILATPRNLIQINSPILAEALEDEKCKKEFTNSIEEFKKSNKEDYFSPLMYSTLAMLKANETHLVNCIAIAQEEREELRKALAEDNVFKMAKSIWALRAFTTSIVYYVTACTSFFNETGLDDMYKFLIEAATTYADQVIEIESLMYKDEEDN